MVGTNGSKPLSPYEQKFANFIRFLAETEEEAILIHHPEVLRDDYDEIVESLNRVAEATSESTYRSSISVVQLRACLGFLLRADFEDSAARDVVHLHREAWPSTMSS